MSNQPVNHTPIVRQQDSGNFNMTSGPGLPADQMNSSVVSIEQQRAIAEAQGQLVLAKRFPRNFAQAMEEIMTSCAYMEFAEEAFYALPRGGQTVRGPSIRLAEEIARCYGNFQYGHRELARNEGESVVEVYAWDVEKNNRSTRQITIPHIMDTRSGGKKLTGQKEITDYIANVASKQMRSRILALLPKPLVAAAVRRCEQTLAGTGEQTIQQRLEKMQGMFIKYGVTVKMLESYLNHPLSETTTDEITDLIAVYTAIKDGGNAKDFFTVSSDPVDDESSKNVKDIIAKNNAAAAGAGTGNKPNVNTQPTGQRLVKPEPQPQDNAQAGNDAQAAAQETKTATKSDKKNASAGTGKKTAANAKTEAAAAPQTEDKSGVETAGAAVDGQGAGANTPLPDHQPEDPLPPQEEDTPNVDLTPPPMDIPPPESEDDYF